MRSAAVCLALLGLAACGPQPRPVQADQADRLNAAGTDALAAGHAQAAVARFTAAAEASGSVDDREGLSRDLHNRGIALIAAGETQAGCTDLRESLHLADASDAHLHDRARTRLALAAGLVALGDVEGASAAVATALDEAERDGDGAMRARALASRAALALRRGDLDAATADLDAAAQLCGPDDGARGAVEINRGHLALRRGDPSAAAAAYATAETVFRRIGELGGLAVALESTARAAEAAGDAPAAGQAWRRAAQIPFGGQAARAQRLAEAARLAP